MGLGNVDCSAGFYTSLSMAEHDPTQHRMGRGWDGRVELISGRTKISVAKIHDLRTIHSKKLKYEVVRNMYYPICFKDRNIPDAEFSPVY